MLLFSTSNSQKVALFDLTGVLTQNIHTVKEGGALWNFLSQNNIKINKVKMRVAYVEYTMGEISPLKFWQEVGFNITKQEQADNLDRLFIKTIKLNQKILQTKDF